MRAHRLNNSASRKRKATIFELYFYTKHWLSHQRFDTIETQRSTKCQKNLLQILKTNWKAVTRWKASSSAISMSFRQLLSRSSSRHWLRPKAWPDPASSKRATSTRSMPIRLFRARAGRHAINCFVFVSQWKRRLTKQGSYWYAEVLPLYMCAASATASSSSRFRTEKRFLSSTTICTTMESHCWNNGTKVNILARMKFRARASRSCLI